jgi:hypothetical protein
MTGPKTWGRWTRAEEAVIRRLYATRPTSEIARRLGRDVRAIYSKAYAMGLRKSPEFFEHHKAGRTNGDRGLSTRFKPGHVPWTKGKKGYMAGGRSAETRFRKGSRPHNTVPVGTETVDACGYLKRKVRDDAPPGMSRKNWAFVHILLWEEHNGPVPAGHAVTFVNGDRTDIRIENLELIDRRDLMRRNTVHNLPKEVAQAVQLRGAVNRIINRRLREREEQDGRSA